MSLYRDRIAYLQFLVSDDDSGGGRASRISWLCPPGWGGTYYVRIRHHNANIYGEQTQYDLHFTTEATGPVITNLQPRSGPIGTGTTIAGRSFGATQGSSTVTFNGVPATPTSWSDVQIQAPVPEGATSGPVVATVNDTASNGVTFTVTAPGDDYEPDNNYPDATQIVPSARQSNHNFHIQADEDWAYLQAVANTEYTIRTENLGSRCDTFLSLYAGDGTTLIAADDDSGPAQSSLIIWTCPTSGTYYIKVRSFDIRVFGPNTQYDLVVAISGATPRIDSLNPDSGVVATPVTITGVNFGATQDGSTVTFNGVAAAPTNWSDTEIVAPVPAGATTGNVLVTVGGITSNPKLFTVFAGDQYEPDDAYAQASTITPGTPQPNHNFHVAGDQDWAAFSANAGSQYVIRTYNLGVNCDTLLHLYHSNGTTLLASDNNGGGGLSSLISWNCHASGTYYVKVAHTSATAYGAPTHYHLSITESAPGPMIHSLHPSSGTVGTPVAINGANFGDTQDGSTVTFNGVAATPTEWNDTRIIAPVPEGATTGDVVVTVGGVASNGLLFTVTTSGADPYEPDNTREEASTMEVGSCQPGHNFHVAKDEDWVKFAAVAGTRYHIVTSNLGIRCDTFLYLYQANGMLITADDDGGEGRASRISWLCAESGVYYVRVRNYNAGIYGANTHYDLTISQAATTPRISALIPASGEIGTPVTIKGVNFGATQNGSLVTFNDIPATPTEWSDTQIVAPVPEGATTGNVVVTVNGVASNGMLFTVSSAQGDQYEPDNVVSQASDLALGTPQLNHNFHVARDVDWVRFAANAGSRYLTMTYNLGANCDTFLYLYNADGRLLEANDDGGAGRASLIRWLCPTSGDYYLKVRHYKYSVCGVGTNYSLLVAEYQE